MTGFSKPNLEIKFLTNHHFLLEIEECLPQPATKFLPAWWAKIPLRNEKFKTVKMCPSFADLYSSGYVIPMWTDTMLRRLPSGEFEWETSDGLFTWQFHDNKQFLSHLDQNKFSQMQVFKALSPWFIWTPKNVSVWQKPLFFDFEEDYKVLEGIIHTDYHHEINQQVLYTSKENEIFIPRGKPFAWYFPFERKKYKYIVKETDESEKRKLTSSLKRVTTKFHGSYIEHLKNLKKEII